MAISRNTLRLLASLRVTVGSEADGATRAITAGWVRAWDELHAAWRATVDDLVAEAARTGRWPARWELARMHRLQTMLDASTEALATLAKRAGVSVTDAAGRAIQATAEIEPRLIASQLPGPEQPQWLTVFTDRVAAQSALDVIVARTTTQVTALTWPLSGEATEAMRRELIRGVAAGDNPNRAASAMVARVQGAFEGGLTRAVNIARTETLDAYRAASAGIHHANSDVLSGWTWLATRDRRLCPACLAMNGSEHPLSQPGPLDHQQGRCARLPTVKPWSQLGISTPEPDDLTPDLRAWFAGLPEDDQLRIMGPTRLELLRSGQIGWDDLATRRRTSGWRDSYAPTPVRNLTARAAA